jgi:predicted ester cyclase
MDARQITQAFADAFNAGDLDTVSEYISDNFVFSGGSPEPIGKQQWLGMSYALYAAFPDLQYNLLITGVEGDTVYTTTQITGTHTNDLDLTALGLGVIPATGNSISLPVTPSEGIVEGGKLVSIHVHEVEGVGLPGILAQIGVKIPAR